MAQVNIAVPLLLGQAAAWHLHATYAHRWLLLAFAWGVFIHLYIVFANDVADSDTDSGARTMVSGGSGILVDGTLEKQSVARAAVVMGAAVWAVAATVSWLGRVVALPMTAAGFLLLLAYHRKPLNLSYRGGGELLQGLGVGGVLPAFGFALQSGTVPGWWLLVPPILAGTASNVLTAMPDIENDTRVNKRTLPVRVGMRASMLFSSMTILLAGILAAVATPDLEQHWRVAIGLVALAAPACLALGRHTLGFVIAQSAVHTLLLCVWSLAMITPSV